ncbi:hypothetical protein JCM19992_13700 [Thermostilla marina]
MATNLPDYVASAKPVPLDQRTPWYKSTAPTYAGIMLWFVFWQQVPALDGSIVGGGLAAGLGVAIGSLIVAALICHYLFYLVPGKLGVQTGLPLYIVGTSTYGVIGGFILPGFLMGCLQFGWLSVNAYFTSGLLCKPFGIEAGTPGFWVVAVAFIILATVLGIAGIQYVAKVATYLPLLPLAVLIILTVLTIGGIGKFDAKQFVADAGAPPAASENDDTADDATAAPADAEDADDQADEAEEAAAETEDADEAAEAAEEDDADQAADAEEQADDAENEAAAGENKSKPGTPLNVLLVMCTVVVGFFATAGAAGVDFGMGNRDEKDVQLGGLVGIAGAIVLTGVLSLLIVAGAYGMGYMKDGVILLTPNVMNKIPALGEKGAGVLWYLLAIAAFPPACFSSFIAANSFKTTLPKVNPFVSCGIGAAIAAVLVITGAAGNAAGVFTVIGASFGPVCGAMAADYLLAGRKWAGPRAGFNPAGWISWLVGFVVGGIDLILGTSYVPCPPVAAFLVGFVLYFILAKAGMESAVLEMPQADAGEEQSAEG